MGVPTGEIVARPLIARACGCVREFQHYAVDKYRAQRLAKFQTTRCEECVAKLAEEQRRAAAALPKKGEAFRQLPLGTRVSMTRQPDGKWVGTLAADGTTVEATAEWPHGLAISLARLWVMARGAAPDSKESSPAAT